MKKHLIAAAVAAAVAVPAMAQNVTIYGIMDIGYAATDSQRTGAGFPLAPLDRDLTDTGAGGGSLSTSRLGFQGSEDLGGGLKASFRLEYGLEDVGNGAAFATGATARESWVAIGGGFGEVKLGRAATAIHGVIAGFSTGAANNTAGAIYTSSANTRTDQMRPHFVYGDNLVQFTSPTMNGFKFTAELGKQDDEQVTGATGAVVPTENSSAGFSLTYSGGPLNVGMGYQKRDQESVPTAATFDATFLAFSQLNTNGVIANSAGTRAGAAVRNNVAAELEMEMTTQAYGASYNFGVATPFLLHTRNEMRADAYTINQVVDFLDVKKTEVGVRVPVSGAVNAFGSMYDGKADYQQSGNQIDLKGFQLGATYSMSKRTTLYSIFGRSEASFSGNGNAANARDSESDMYAIGLRHSF